MTLGRSRAVLGGQSSGRERVEVLNRWLPPCRKETRRLSLTSFSPAMLHPFYTIFSYQNPGLPLREDLSILKACGTEAGASRGSVTYEVSLSASVNTVCFFYRSANIADCPHRSLLLQRHLDELLRALVCCGLGKELHSYIDTNSALHFTMSAGGKLRRDKFSCLMYSY